MNIKCAYTKLLNVSELKPNPKNPNKHPKEQVKRLAKIIEYQGQRSPIIVSNLSGFIVKGHGRLKAIKLLGWKQCAVDFQDYESSDQEMADVVADNAIALWADLDLDSIKQEALNFDTEFDLDFLGFESFELPKEDKSDIEDEIPEQVEPKTKIGDIYQLGNHRLMCGDSTSIDNVEKLMNGEKADLVHTDPPYNVDYSNQDRPKAGKKDLGRIENDKMGDAQFREFLEAAFLNTYIVSGENSSIYIWYASKETLNFYAAAVAAGWSINQQIIWKKPMLLGRGKYQWAHEPCIFGIKGSPYFTEDRTKTTVWDFGGYDKSKNIHPTQKPVFVPEEAISNSCQQGSNVLDLFGGSGSTLIACEKTNRKCFMMELDPHYCDVIIARWEKYTGQKAVLSDEA